MPEAKPAEERDDDPEAREETDEVTAAFEVGIDGLKNRGDVDGLLLIAKTCRSGTGPNGRDMKQCLEAYRAAAELGSGDAEYAVALFCLTGGVVPQDLKEGATRLRSAAEKGSVAAKVYLGNLYELGIHYKADPEKADVWYRNAARGARIAAEPGSEEYARELAELGCVRHVLALTESSELAQEEKARLLQRARAHGHGLRIKDDAASERPTFLGALEAVEAKPTSAAKVDEEPAKPEATKEQPKLAPPEPKPKPVGPTQKSIGLAAFGYALLFALTGIGAGYAAMLGARELVAHGQALPGLGTRADLVFPIVLFVIGVLPSWLVYKLGTVVRALVIGAAFGGMGWVAWGTGQAALHAARSVQALSFGLAGFLAGLLVLGLLGGTKKQPPRQPKTSRHPTG